MKPFCVFALIAIVLGTSACASRPIKSDAAPVVAEAPEQTGVNDPWESYNRRVYGFNSVVDKVVMRPVAVAYDWITPHPVQAGVTRFLGNLREPATAVNQVLQMHPAKAANTLARFVVNTTVGVAGVFDPATRFGMDREQEDFGQTLATWGWRDSRYFVMPLLGPRTVRDTVGMFGDQPLSPIGRVDNSAVANSLTVLQLADGRASMLQMDGMREFALDEYAMVRDIWMQRRTAQIEKDL